MSCQERGPIQGQKDRAPKEPVTFDEFLKEGLSREEIEHLQKKAVKDGRHDYKF